MAGPGKRGRSGGRRLSVRVRTAKGRKAASTRWLERQLNDPYVAEARKRGYRSRSALKLIQLDDKFHFLGPGKRVVDLGAAPGGWTQVAVERVGAGGPARARGAAGAEGAGKASRIGCVIALDMAGMEPVAAATVVQRDVREPGTLERLRELLDGPADVVLSDMAPGATGHAATDHLRIVALAEAALAFAREVLAPGGVLVAKVYQGGAQRELLAALKRDFATVKHAKPPASRPESAETYVVAMGFRAAARTTTG